MMVLRSSPASPFGRKVKLALAICGLKEKVRVDIADTNNPDDSLRKQNPLGKIPALVLDNGKVIYDSTVILEYVDHLAGGGKIIPTDDSRFDVLTLHALADGIMDAALLRVYEKRFREPQEQSQKWADYQGEKVQRGLAVLEAAPPAIGATPHVGVIGIACALGYLDLRFEGEWRKDHPRLVAWLDQFSARIPAFEETRFKP
ncbi:MAG: glutathione S-transferase family protein [Beijerinckiaceae bacterium]